MIKSIFYFVIVSFLYSVIIASFQDYWFEIHLISLPIICVILAHIVTRDYEN